MDSPSYIRSFDILEYEFTGLVQHLGPLLKLLSEEYKGTGNAGDKLAQSFTHKATSCEMLTSYALSDLLAAISEHFNYGKPSVPDSSIPSVNEKQIILRPIMPKGFEAGYESFAPSTMTKSEGVEIQVLPARKMAICFLSHEAKVWFRVALVMLFSFPTASSDPEVDPQQDPSVTRQFNINPLEDRYNLLTDEQKLQLIKIYLKSQRPSPGSEAKALMEKQKRLIAACKEVLGGKHLCQLALHDFLFFLATSTKDLRATCDVLGPALFVPCDTNLIAKRVPELKNRSEKLRRACSGLLVFLVENQNPIFNNRKRPFEEEFNNALSNLQIEDLEKVRLSRLKQHLRHFFELRDPPYVRIVGFLFEFYEFDDIATGVFAKYRILPFGWKQELEKASGHLSSSEFDPFNTYLAPLPGNDLQQPAVEEKGNNYLEVEGSYFEAADESENNNSPEIGSGQRPSFAKSPLNKTLSEKIDNSNGNFAWLKTYLEKKKVAFLTEKTLSWPETSPLKVYAPVSKNPGKVDPIIEEFLDTQRNLLATLKSFQTHYVSEIIAISNGDLGQEAQEALGLNSADVKILFKNNLKQVISAQEKLVVTLEPLSLVKDGKLRNEWKEYGRAGVLFFLFTKCQDAITKGFQHYNVSYSLKVDTLKKKLDELDLLASSGLQRSTNGGNAGLPFGSPLPTSPDLGKSQLRRKASRNPSNLFKIQKRSNSKHLNFSELWDEISQTKVHLNNKKLDTVLIMPVQAFPRYKLFLERILKGLGPDYPGADLGAAAVKAADAIAFAVDDKIRNNKNVMTKVLGAD